MNLAERLAREIRRVTELRATYREIGSKTGINVEPARLMMHMALESACKAAGLDDATVQRAALAELEGFEK